MSLLIGLVGLPNVGKSTLFNALTSSNVLAANYPFATIDPNKGIVNVPDVRLAKLAELYDTEKIVPATVTFLDIAGLVAGASHGEGLGNQFLSHIRSSNAIAEVVRVFKDPNVVHVDQAASPQKDIDVIKTELILADLQTIDKRLHTLEKEAKANPKLKDKVNLLKDLQSKLDDNQAIYELEDVDTDLISDLQLLTAKPILFNFNVDEDDFSNTELKNKLSALVSPAPAIFVSAKLESELQSLDEADAKELLESYGQTESALVQLINESYKLLGLQSYLTAGPKEVRAWTIDQGMTAQQAAGVIHTDFAKGFIAAEVVKYEDLIKAGSLVAARSSGLVRSEGKDYIMQPNDVVEFRFNV